MGRRYNIRPTIDSPIGGGRRGDQRPIASPFANECKRCGEDMESEADMTRSRGGWIHKRCASGATDE